MALSLFCVWLVYFGFRSEVSPGATIPAWNSYQHPLPERPSLIKELETPLVRGQLTASGQSDLVLPHSRFMQAVHLLDNGAVKDSVCARLRIGGTQGDVWAYAARLSLSARLLHWQIMFKCPDGVRLLGRHNGWPVWKLEEEHADASPVYFAFADGMLFASTGLSPVGVFDLLDQYDGLIP